MTNHIEPVGTSGAAKITLRTAGELAEALPYLLGFRPDDSIVLVALYKGRFGGRVRLGIPERSEDWPSVAQQLARCLVGGCERRDGRPDSVVAFLCQDASARSGASGPPVVERLRPLAQLLRTECGVLDVPVTEALCLSDGRYWSYCCPRPDCCPPEGNAIAAEGTSVMAATAAYAGIHVRQSVAELTARLAPLDTALVPDQTRALDAAAMDLVPRILAGAPREEVETQTLGLARLVLRRLAEAPCVDDTLDADLRDDELLAHDEAAVLILGLQDRLTRDRAAEWMEGEEAPAALRLWRALARRCVGGYGEHAAAPLTLAGWVAWSLGDTVEADHALEMALSVDPQYKFARLLNQARSEGVDPEPVRQSLRRVRADREAEPAAADATVGDAADGLASAEAGTDEELVPCPVPEGAEEEAGDPAAAVPVGPADPGISRAARGLAAALRRRGERRSGAGSRPARAGTRAPRRPSGRRTGRPQSRGHG
ncbi:MULTISPECIES: DUF4192 domain-containing protein [unclassified Streptomyces]|uniref:DUF4192 domain-containing protein n=1 Tax=unclassified Streptomyces TaxID=2593676 RepID=UPI000DBA9D06|nr:MULTISPECIES: DUF4192 domain-containing protein [unclassified Streptomyces]MYT74168.1 DUF4192 family protein [Streptomyces sp. SID8367]RAJ89586.1 uncharacterized protein DUF4192 [Streptomyces sp. PsTaAH-137]